MALNQHELFQKLLEQLNLEEQTQTAAFAQGEIRNLTVHEQRKAWSFVFHFADILPFEAFNVFAQHLNQAFAEIAAVEFTIETDHPATDIENVDRYWRWAVSHSGLNEQFARQLCEGVEPALNGDQVVITAPNQVVADFLSGATLDALTSTYRRLGFGSLAFTTTVDEAASAERLAAFQEVKAKRDEEMVTKAAAVIAKNKANQSSAPTVNGPVSMGRKIKDDEPTRRMDEITEEERSVTVSGYVFAKEIRVLRSGRQLLTLKITDYTSSFLVKKFSRNEDDEANFAAIPEKAWVKVRGSVQEDNFSRDLAIIANDLQVITHTEREDTAPEDGKRVELHLHTQMSTMDATNNIGDFVERAAKWGHKALAITDHAGLQGFPDAFHAAEKAGIKMLYGVEVNLVDDGEPIGINDAHEELKGHEYVVFDVETTGLSAIYDKVIELSAVKMRDGNVLEQFEEFIDPGFHLSETTTNLTSITDAMVAGSKTEEEVFKLFREWYGDAILVGHNVTFDVGFMNTGYVRHGMPEISNPIIDTLTLARFLYPTLKGYRLNTLAKKFNVSLEHHHRAIFDAESTGYLAMIFLKDAEKRYDIVYHDQLNEHMSDNDAYKHARPFHATVIAQTQTGLKNLFELVSLSNIKYYYRVPRVPRSELNRLREGLLVGSACSSGEVFEAAMQKGKEEALKRAKYYDYLEVQPKPLYKPLIEGELIHDNAKLEEIIQTLVEVADELDKPLVATGDVHYLDPHDAVYRKILISSQGGANPLNRHSLPDVHFRTTDEMLKEFSFLGDEKATELVVTNPNKIVDMVDDVHPLKDKLYTPRMEGAEDEMRSRTMNRAHELYGDPLPDLVQKRVDRELKSIIGNGFSVIYLIAQRLVHKSNKDGYLVGSRGSVGSSVVATFAGITEVNPLAPHYLCPNPECKHSEFFTHGEYSSGYDLPDKKCPECGTELTKDGQNIPFETFLGFKGNKVPDIDLNFSGDYQPIAHNYTKVLFGEDNVYRAGTIGTVADKTAYGYVKGYERDHEVTYRQAEVDRLSSGATGVKRTTGQHPAGIIVVPDYMDIYDFTPIQYPADDQDAAWKTTHFDFHSIHDNILKIDILGHDDPTMIRTLQDMSGIEPKTIPTDDPGVMQLFSGTEVLGVTEEQIFSKTGTLGIPEFGTRFVRGMLEETHPKNYSELLQISGLSHGTDVWLGNAEELIKDGTATIANVIGCRDNIMTDLINYGLDSEMSFQIMEHVRKGRGIPDEWQDAMREANVPQWYIDSCLKIKYMFPRAHASAYILMALRVAYFKVYFPMLYYAAYFSVRADDFDLVSMSRGKNAVKAAMKTIMDKGNDASTKEKNLLTVLELANEMLERGYSFKMIDVERSDAQNWIIDGETLIAPFNAVPGLGDNVAKQIVAAREEKPFLSKEDLSKRGKVSATIIDFLTENHVLDDLPDENQLSLF
ncbi:PolC-type DNA polymerase III [Furfurilactobacillus siliginis]|uniref:DNA polymerase III PolC-type n=1 Tax=Furfurilactobacillus siliginis TaxID=348151 RepID=A0A0R2L0Q0_9LACO|nr:PolC-type DNA polymerase III [Furfurilactobacillus siliginis]KRN95375.1 DNA polymerase III PolC [Furfurilactobacillus siliginis]GEK28155.1 DNA polymerase III PolC-type [Furfurilactobacillus siliginis]